MQTPMMVSELLSDELKAKLQEARKRIPQGMTHEQFIADAYNEEKGTLKYTDCPKCRNKGYIAVEDANGNMVLKECECMRVRRLFHNLERSGLKGAYEKYKLDTFEAKEAWQKEMLTKAQSYIKDIVKGGTYWLYVGGQRGAGKSHICCAVAGKLIAHGKNVIYKLWQEIASEYKARTYKEDEKAALMNELSGCDVLYIDDFLKCRNRNDIDYNYDLAFTVVNMRYNAKKPTIISSELTIKQLAAEDSALSGRIAEMAGKDYVISIEHDSEKDIRLKKSRL